MKVYRKSLNEANTILDSFLKSGEETELYSDPYIQMRTALEVKSPELKELYLDKGRKYSFDVELGLFLFELLRAQDWFFPGTGSDTDFWRYMAVCTAPKPVYWRWKESREH